MAVALVIFARWDPVVPLGLAALRRGWSARSGVCSRLGITTGYYLFEPRRTCSRSRS